MDLKYHSSIGLPLGIRYGAVEVAAVGNNPVEPPRSVDASTNTHAEPGPLVIPERITITTPPSHGNLPVGPTENVTPPEVEPPTATLYPVPVAFADNEAMEIADTPPGDNSLLIYDQYDPWPVPDTSGSTDTGLCARLELVAQHL